MENCEALSIKIDKLKPRKFKKILICFKNCLGNCLENSPKKLLSKIALENCPGNSTDNCLGKCLKNCLANIALQILPCKYCLAFALQKKALELAVKDFFKSCLKIKQLFYFLVSLSHVCKKNQVFSINNKKNSFFSASVN